MWQTLASNLMAELGFSSRTMQSKSSGFQIDVDGGIDMAYKWLKKYHHELQGSKVYSIDCVFTGHRTDRHKSFAVRGGAAPNFSAKVSSFTACGIYYGLQCWDVLPYYPLHEQCDIRPRTQTDGSKDQTVGVH